MLSSFSCLGFKSRPANSAICVPSLALDSEIPFFPRVIRSTLSSARIEIKRPHSSNMTLRSRTTWRCECMKGDDDRNNLPVKCSNWVVSSGSSEDNDHQVPTQTQSLIEGTSRVVSDYKTVPDMQYLEELLAIQQQRPRAIALFGTCDMGFMHQQLIEILSFAMVVAVWFCLPLLLFHAISDSRNLVTSLQILVPKFIIPLQKNHIFTSGDFGTNAAVIRSALRAEKSELLTVILPQSLKKQPPDSQKLLSKVKNLIEKPENDHLPLVEASRLCNMNILSEVEQVICFAFHDNELLMETCEEAKNLGKIVTLFYLD